MSNVKITEEHIQKILDGTQTADQQWGEKTTIVHATLPNGFEIVANSACVDPKNYDHDLGVSLCMEKIKNKIWELEGYVLQNQPEPEAEKQPEELEVEDLEFTGEGDGVDPYAGMSAGERKIARREGK